MKKLLTLMFINTWLFVGCVGPSVVALGSNINYSTNEASTEGQVNIGAKKPATNDVNYNGGKLNVTNNASVEKTK